jgi:hypothetical protein
LGELQVLTQINEIFLTPFFCFFRRKIPQKLNIFYLFWDIIENTTGKVDNGRAKISLQRTALNRWAEYFLNNKKTN